MNEHDSGRPGPESTSHDGAREDPRLSRLYREARATEDGPPAHLDDAIRAAARRAVASKPASLQRRPLRRWAVPLALAASVVLASGIALRVFESEHESFAPASSPAFAPAAPAPAASSQAQAAPAPGAGPERRAPAPTAPAQPPAKVAPAAPLAAGARPAASAGDHTVASAAKPRQAPQSVSPAYAPAYAPSASPPPPAYAPLRESEAQPSAEQGAPAAFPEAKRAAAAPAPAASAPPAEAASDTRAAPSSRDQLGANQAPRARVSSALAAPPSPALAAEWAQLVNADDWLVYLRKLVDAGRVEDARRSADEFRRRWPAVGIPADVTRAIAPAERQANP